MKKKYLFIILIFLLILTIYTGHNGSNIDFEEIKNDKQMDLVYAYIHDTKLYMKQKDEYKSLLFSLNLLDLDDKIKDGNIAANNIIKIKKEKIDLDNNSKSKNDMENYIKIPIISKEEWSKFVDPFISSKIINFIPKKENAGLLVVMNDKEIVLYRDSNRQINFCFLYDKPNDVTIIKTMDNNDLNHIIIEAVNSNDNLKQYIFHNRVIFQQNYPQFNYPIGLIDLNDNRILYFDYWILYDFKKNIRDITALISLLSSFVIKSHIYTILKNPVTSFSRLLFVAKNQIVKIFSSSKLIIPELIQPIVEERNNMDIVNFNKLLDEKLGNNVFKGTFKLLIDGDEYFLELIKEIEKAKDSIKFRLYIFDNDDYGTMIAQLLKEANQKRNVNIKVLIDSFANITKAIELPDLPFRNDFEQPKSIKLFLKKRSTIETKTSPNTWITFDHVKTLMFDDNVVFTGGMNIGQEYRYSWHDLMVKLQGPIVKSISKEFDDNWAKNDLFGDLALLWQKFVNKSDNYIKNEIIPNDSIDFRLLYTKTWRRDIYHAQMLAIKNSKNYIYIENPYIADRRIINELIKARVRGVDVRIILPKYNNVYIMAKNNNYLINVFLKSGIRVFLYPGMTHVKASIYDDWAMLGSANFDMLSYDINKEFNIAFSDKKAVDTLKMRLFNKDFQISEEITSLEQVNSGDELFSIIANRF